MRKGDRITYGRVGRRMVGLFWSDEACMVSATGDWVSDPMAHP